MMEIKDLFNLKKIVFSTLNLYEILNSSFSLEKHSIISLLLWEWEESLKEIITKYLVCFFKERKGVCSIKLLTEKN